MDPESCGSFFFKAQLRIRMSYHFNQMFLVDTRGIAFKNPTSFEFFRLPKNLRAARVSGFSGTLNLGAPSWEQKIDSKQLIWVPKNKFHQLQPLEILA